MTSVSTTSVPGFMYQKHDSVVEIRHHAVFSESQTRIAALLRKLTEVQQLDDNGKVLQAACEELLGLRVPGDGHPPFTLQSYVQEETSRLIEAKLPRYLLYRYRYETYPQRRILDDFPPCLQIEPASICNYRCTFCYQIDVEFTRKTSGHMGVMPIELFKELVDQAFGRCEAVTLASRGEPLICPQFDEMVRYAAGKFLAMKINTNAWFLDEAKSHAILESDCNTVVFSADAASEPAYSQFRVGGSLERIVANIRRFREIREKHYPGSRTITRVSGVRVPGTPKLDQMEAFWEDVVDQVAFVRYNPWENTYQSPVNDITTPCSELWRRMFIWWDGIANPCDVDYKSTLSIGNIASHRLDELWRSEAYMRLREKHIAMQRARCSPCNRCTVV